MNLVQKRKVSAEITITQSAIVGYRTDKEWGYCAINTMLLLLLLLLDVFVNAHYVDV